MEQQATVRPDLPETRQNRLVGLIRRFKVDGQVLDPRFFGNWRQYVLQCLFVTATMVVILALLDSVHETVLVAALGASSVVAFSAPSLRASRPRCLMGGYLVGVIVGCGMSLLVTATGGLVSLDEHSSRILLGAIAVGLAMFIMVVTNTEHPPAAAIAFGLILHEWDIVTVAVVMAGITSISIIKEFVRRHLIDLL
jgi:CBS-domain-containing membrane protein